MSRQLSWSRWEFCCFFQFSAIDSSFSDAGNHSTRQRWFDRCPIFIVLWSPWWRVTAWAESSLALEGNRNTSQPNLVFPELLGQLRQNERFSLGKLSEFFFVVLNSSNCFRWGRSPDVADRLYIEQPSAFGVCDPLLKVHMRRIQRIEQNYFQEILKGTLYFPFWTCSQRCLLN